tara:strand:+ start:1616 stop:1855 length:240 start_codon:yes stop_codon:yes gene_type:complete
MKWIYGMIVDGTYHQFKDEYEKAVNNNVEEFTWEGKPMQIIFAKNVCFLVDKHLLREYEEHLEQEAIRHQAYIDDPINY